MFLRHMSTKTLYPVHTQDEGVSKFVKINQITKETPSTDHCDDEKHRKSVAKPVSLRGDSKKANKILKLIQNFKAQIHSRF